MARNKNRCSHFAVSCSFLRSPALRIEKKSIDFTCRLKTAPYVGGAFTNFFFSKNILVEIISLFFKYPFHNQHRDQITEKNFDLSEERWQGSARAVIRCREDV